MDRNEWLQTVQALGPRFAKAAAEHDANDSFVGENYALLKQHGWFSAGAPRELGGGGLAHGDLCEVIRQMAHHCSSTALASAMHTHVVATLAYSWRNGNAGAETMLRKVATEGLILATTGGADWLRGSGKLEKVEGGYRLTGRKIFASGAPGADLLMTTGVFEDPDAGATVFHLPIPLSAPGVSVLDTWRVLGMRGTGSNDVQLERVFVPEAATMGVRRPSGKWHPFLHTVVLVALPIVYAAYLGVAEAARNTALALAQKKKDDPSAPYLIGEMENHLVSAQLAHSSMVDLVESSQPGPATTSAVFVRRTNLATAAVRTVEKAMELAGGGAYYRSLPLERLFRDIQAARYHPVQEKPQLCFTGRLLLGLNVDGS
jgi:alkylation response protein AidB-like acyl-CoA dehydrogenase